MKRETFNLFGSLWDIIYCDKIEVEGDNKDAFQYGLSDYTNRIISVATKSRSGDDLPEDEIQITKLHELVHCILTTGMYTACTDDEPLVEWLARSILSLSKQGVIK